jgi:hypothetical protein
VTPARGDVDWPLFVALALQPDGLTVLGPKCHSVECLQPVAARVHWVTGPLLVCSVCSARWQLIAAAMGIMLHVDLIECTPPGLDDAEQRFRLLEMT